jgi:hypothetical protein
MKPRRYIVTFIDRRTCDSIETIVDAYTHTSARNRVLADPDVLDVEDVRLAGGSLVAE